MSHFPHKMFASLAGLLILTTPLWGQDSTAESSLVRQDIQISGVYPHLTTYGVYSQNGAHLKSGHNECGIGAIVPWANRLWLVNYAPHMPHGSEHKLFSIDNDLNLTIHPESVGGTPAARMIHRESNQLLIAHYLIDATGKIRTISPAVMPGRLTAIARHLVDPENMVYYIDMEGMIYEANVHSLEVKKLFHKPVPGWHGKGGYTAQGRLVVSNNGEYKVGGYDDLQVGGPPKNSDEAGVLAEWDGTTWNIVERKQFTDVTGPGGIFGAPDENAPLWAMGWDRRSVRLKLLDGGEWSTFLLPKATHNNDPIHGWYTEWPRIREIGEGRMLMDMHGMLFDFPKTFSKANTAGIRPHASHLRYIPDFCHWNDQLVIASDETSIQGNDLAGQPQSNLWFGQYEQLQEWGPRSAYGGPWVGDDVHANVPSDPFLIAGFPRRVMHLNVGKSLKPLAETALRTSDQLEFLSIPETLRELPRVTVPRGDWHKPAAGFSFEINQPATVYLAVDQRGDTHPGAGWQKTDMETVWKGNRKDTIYTQNFAAGVVTIPDNTTEHTAGAYGMPHTAFVKGEAGMLITPSQGATLTRWQPEVNGEATASGPVAFQLEVDREGTGDWTPYETLSVAPGESLVHHIPDDLNAEWLRLTPSRDCSATAYFHLTDNRFQHHEEGLFAGLVDVTETDVRSALVYAAKKNRNLRLITPAGFREFSKATFQYQATQPDERLQQLLEVEPEFTVDAASVILQTRDGRLRLPKGHAAFDKPCAGGWPRGSREVESERHLANFHGTFYEVPLITNGAPPAFQLMRPVASHSKQIIDFCTWNGLLVLSGVKPHATGDHVFFNDELGTSLWFGAVDDLWKLGKPVGRGGPWLETHVSAGDVSDPYLMTGYDKKQFTLTSDTDTILHVEIDVDHQTGWHAYQSFSLKAGVPRTHHFPTGFSAHWVRFRTEKAGTVSAQLLYQ